MQRRAQARLAEGHTRYKLDILQHQLLPIVHPQSRLQQVREVC